jgi:hypothetical protein
LVADSFLEEFVEIELVLDQELNCARIERQNPLVHDLGIVEGVHVERPLDVGSLLLIPFVSGKPHLKRVHPLTVVL